MGTMVFSLSDVHAPVQTWAEKLWELLLESYLPNTVLALARLGPAQFALPSLDSVVRRRACPGQPAWPQEPVLGGWEGCSWHLYG